MRRCKISNTTLKPFVVFALHRLEFLRDILVRGEYLPQAHECAHDGEIYLDGAGAVEDAGEHRDALLREGVWQVTPPAPLLWLIFYSWRRQVSATC